MTATTAAPAASAPPAPAAADPRLDALIIAAATPEGCKVAMLIARTTDAARAEAIEAPAQVIAARIYALVADQKLEATGNIRRWRAAEVRRAGPVNI